MKKKKENKENKNKKRILRNLHETTRKVSQKKWSISGKTKPNKKRKEVSLRH